MSTKERVLACRRQINEFKASEEMRELVATRQQLLTKIQEGFQLLQLGQYRTEEEFLGLNSEMSRLNDQHKKVEREYEERLYARFKDFADTYPGIYALFIKDEVDERSLMHVLETYDQVEKGKLPQENALDNGKQFMKRRFNLPQDFFRSTTKG